MQAVKECVEAGLAVGHIHLRHINPLPHHLGTLLNQYDTVLAPDPHHGQLATLLPDNLLAPPDHTNPVRAPPLPTGAGQPT